MTVDHRVYSTAQLSVANNFANWIQQSYVPVGGLGDVIRFVSAKLTAGNQDTKSLPQSYGANAKIYTDLKYGAAGKVEPATNGHILWSVSANDVYGEPAIVLSTPEQYYFTLPTFAEQGTNYGDELEKAVDLSTHPVLGRFPAYFYRNSVTGNQKYRPALQGQPAAVREADQGRISRRPRCRPSPGQYERERIRHHGSEPGRQGPDRSGHGGRRPAAGEARRRTCGQSRAIQGPPAGSRGDRVHVPGHRRSRTVPTRSWGRAAAASAFPSTRSIRRWPRSARRAGRSGSS